MTPASENRSPRPRIRPLPERLINKIAAGEVVERPASVVKELVENALDAGAGRIEIIIEKSGVSLIKIVDDGCGIDEDQIEIAFSRHATSKISDSRDLDRIVSYGFRGEALPSIASVSRMRMVSRPGEADSAAEIVIEGGVLQSRQPVAAGLGTTVEVENLFYNTPARRKFLKAETTEARHISRVAMAMAMSRSVVGFTYRLNGRKIFSLPTGQPPGERVAALLTPGKKLIEATGESGPLRLEAYVGPPDLAQSNRNSQYFFVNGRYVHSPMMSHAFAQGYGESLPRGNFPVGALFLTVDPMEIDVNVHPAKTEVRLSCEREIHSLIHHAVHDGLQRAGVVPSLKVPGYSHGSGEQPAWTPSRDPSSGQANYKIPGVGQHAPYDPGMLAELYKAQPPAADPLPGIARVDTSTGEIVELETSAVPSTPLSAEGFYLIGRFADLYLLFQRADELYIVDQHTAHERVLFEETLRWMNHEGGVAQRLLLPVQVELNAEQMAVFEESESLLNHSGFDIAPFGGTTVRIEAVPSILSRKSPEKAILAVLDDIASLKGTGYDLKKAIAQSIACRSAVMAGDRLDDREAEALISRLMKCGNAYSCPHGRPTLIKISRDDLDKQFGRG